ncbi:MAG: TonB-dependent receptor [Ignavibacteriae bacterium]|nr:TonB-dependent receptor [Ignavibacteriota bacterium]
MILAASTNVWGQQPTSPQPLELPDIIISGTEKIDVPAGIKQIPKKPSPLSAKELDSLNTLEKQPPLLLPLGMLQFNRYTPKFSKGFIRGEFGQYISPLLEAGYGTEFGGYAINALAGYTSSSGHLDNADFSIIKAHLNADYIAPEKYLFFGGSKTETTFDFNRKAYNLYAIPSALERTTTDFVAKIGVKGNYNSFGYSAGGSWSSISLKQDTNSSVADNALNGHLAIQNTWNDIIVGGSLLLDLHTIRGNSTNYIEAGGFAEYILGNFTFNGIAAVQTANTSGGVTLAGIKFSAQTEYRMNQLFTFRGGLGTGLENNSFRDMLHTNPYLADSAFVTFPRDHITVNATINYYPVETLSAAAGLVYKLVADTPLFTSTSSGTFLPFYAEVSSLEIHSELAWKITPLDNITAFVAITSASLPEYADSASSSVPYISPFKITSSWHRNWSEQFGTQITAQYVASRYADIAKQQELSGFTTFNLRGEYAISPSAGVYLRLDNVFNSTVFLWNGYKERGIFISAGINWRF